MSEAHKEEEVDVETKLLSTTKWAMSYGDMMSVLMILFLLLYSFAAMGSSADMLKKINKFQQSFGAKENSSLANTVKQIDLEEDVADQIKGFIQENNLSEYAVVKVDDYQIKLMMTQSVMFQKGSFELMETSEPVLEKLTELLTKISNHVVIEGHTDDLPIQGGSNFDLSTKRALAVLQFFTDRNMSPARFSIAGYGSFRPIAKNDTEENRQRNRRVEINIIRKHRDLLTK
ncbi:MAG: flagellar motor protein MotB [Candidatus Margulisbacteria bacterium]|nr:flagellar motor protein MotB [Candidatus Margulisiibacteriota bacterium]